MNDKGMKQERLLLVDDDEVFLGVLGKALLKRGYQVLPATSIAGAMAQARDSIPQLAVVDLKLEQESGLDLIPMLKEFNPEITIVVLTGYASIATAVSAIKRGASDYLCKPVTAGEVVNALSEERSGPADDDFSTMSVEQLEWEHIQKVLKQNKGNISATARSLGMYRRTLQRKLAKKPAAQSRKELTDF
jgi:two-component system response regulator RegA